MEIMFILRDETKEGDGSNGSGKKVADEKPQAKLDSEGNPIVDKSEEGKEGDSGKSEGGEKEKTFTQAELDAILKTRLERQKAQNQEDPELARKAEAFDKIEEGKKTSLEKAEGDKSSAEDRNKALEAELLTERKRNAFNVEAQRRGVLDVDLAWLAVDQELITEKDGQHLAADAVNEVLERKPVLKGRPSGGGNGGAGNEPENQIFLNDEQRGVAKAMGFTDKDYWENMTPEDQKQSKEAARR